MRLPETGEQDSSQHQQAGISRYLQRRHLIRAGLALVVAVASIIWLWRASEFELVWPLLASAHPVALTLSVVLLGLSLLVKSLRWRVLLPAEPRISRFDAYRIFHISVLLNNLLPFRLGDGARVLSSPVRRTATAQQALVVLVVERLLDGLALVLMALVFVPIFLRDARRPLSFPAFTMPDIPQWVLVTALLVGIAVVAAAVTRGWRARTARSAPRVRPGVWLHSLRRDILLLAQMPARQLGVVGISTVTMWTGTFLLHYVLMTALGVHDRTPVDPLVLAIVVTLATNISMLAPATPANIGLFHAAAAAPLLAAGLSTEVAVAYALLVHAVNTVPPMLMGAACLGAPAISSRLASLRGATAAS